MPRGRCPSRRSPGLAVQPRRTRAPPSPASRTRQSGWATTGRARLGEVARSDLHDRAVVDHRDRREPRRPHPQRHRIRRRSPPRPRQTGQAAASSTSPHQADVVTSDRTNPRPLSAVTEPGDHRLLDNTRRREGSGGPGTGAIVIGGHNAPRGGAWTGDTFQTVVPSRPRTSPATGTTTPTMSSRPPRPPGRSRTR